ncbi:MAG: ABC transporter substrate-binding protein [Candidatus Rokubacteria bacterium]|nr:ABC transporter substrate-binding protein [Candidatus Rokubacteria bacterium]
MTYARAFAAILLVVATFALVTPVTAQTRFVFANESPYDTLDPHTVFDVGRVAVRLNLYDGLYRWVDNPPVLQPWLAESHTVSSDGLSYTFKLRRGARFHDGAEITAEDVRYSTERILALKKGAASLLATMIGPNTTKAVDKHTVRFTLTKPTAIFTAVVPEVHVVNSALLKKNTKGDDWGAAWLTSNEAGSGSYQLSRYDPAIGFIAKRFAGHFMPWGQKWIDEIEFRHVKEDNTRVLGMIKGDFQGTGGYLPIDQVKRLRDAQNVKIVEQESMRIMMFQINNQRAPFTDVHVRRAMNYAFDYDGFIKDILSGSVERNPVPIPNNMWGVPKDIKGYSYNLDKAKAELGQAKQKIDRPITVGYLTGFSQTEQAATVMANGLRKLGLETKLVGELWPTMVDRMKKPETSPDLVVYWISTYYADPNNWIGEMFHSGQWGTFKASCFYKNPKVDDLLDTALKSTDRKVREKAYQDAARIVYEDAAGVWIYNTKYFGPWAKDLEGIRFSPIGNGQEMRWVYYAK